jgi:hypothetical protein
MGELRVVKTEELAQSRHRSGVEKPGQLGRFKAVTRNLAQKTLEIVNRISIKEMSKPEPQAELIEDYYLLYHYLDFLKRFSSLRM